MSRLLRVLVLVSVGGAAACSTQATVKKELAPVEQRLSTLEKRATALEKAADACSRQSEGSAAPEGKGGIKGLLKKLFE